MMDLPTFRSDLEIITRTGWKRSLLYLVKNPDSGGVFEFKEEEYFLCKQCNGQNSLFDIQSRFKNSFNINLDIEQLKAFINQLDREGLLVREAGKTSAAFDLFPYPSHELWKRWNLFNPVKLLSWLYPKFRWCYTKTFVIASAVFIVLALGILYNNSSDFFREVKLFFVSFSLIEDLAIHYICFNNIVVIAQGLTAIHHGGHAKEVGVRLEFDFFPNFYCMVGGWDKMRRSGRSWVFFAPSYYALLAASMGMLIWKISSPGIVLHKFGIILIIVCAINLAIRFNILWPFDASYMLSNWLGIPFFQERAMAVAKAWILRRPLPEPLSSRDKKLFKWYGLLVVFVILFSIVAIAYYLSDRLIHNFAGIGALIFLFGAMVTFRKDILQWLKQRKSTQWIMKKLQTPGSRKKITIIGGIILLLSIPYPYKPGGDFTFLPAEHIELNTQVSGEIKKVLVKEGEAVTSGQIIALLDTRDHQKELDVTQANLDKAKADLRLLELGPKPEEIEQAEKQVFTAQTRYEYSSREAERLKSLFAEGVVSEEEYQAKAKMADVDAKDLETAKAHFELVKSGTRPEEIEAQKAVIRNLEAQFQYYQENITLTKLIAPISGQIVTPYIEKKVGQVLNKGDLFATIQDTSIIQAELQIPEGDIGEVKLGAQVKVRPWAYPTKYFYGTVVAIAPKAEDTSSGKIVRVLTEIPNPEFKLKPDMTGEAKIKGTWKPFIIAFTRPIVRFFMVEVWSWFP